MGLIPINEILPDARKYKYAIGGFNIFNLEMLDPIVNAANSENSPVVVQVYSGDLENVNGEYIAAMTAIASKKISVPIALQLDHGMNYESAMSCIEWGFSSIMIDFSRADLEENIKDTKQAVKEAHRRGVSIEAELGEIYNGVDPVEIQKSSLTDLDLAVRFVKETGVDALAVSVGTAHGVYSYGPDIDFDLLRSLAEKISVPIVIHGGSYIPNHDVLKMIQHGVAKINVGMELLIAFNKGLESTINAKKNDDTFRNILYGAQKGVEKVVREKIRLFNTRRK